MQNEEKAFWHIELVAHCVCWSCGSRKLNRIALVQLSTVIPFKQNKENPSLRILLAAQ